MPPARVDPFAELMATLSTAEMQNPKVFNLRVQELVMAHLLDNGHTIRVRIDRLALRTAKRHGLQLRLWFDEDTAELVADVVDKDGKPVQPQQGGE